MFFTGDNSPWESYLEVGCPWTRDKTKMSVKVRTATILEPKFVNLLSYSG